MGFVGVESAMLSIFILKNRDYFMDRRIEKKLDDYIGEVYYLPNKMLEVTDKKKTHHLGAIINLKTSMENPLKIFVVAQGTSLNSTKNYQSIHPDYKDIYVPVWYTNFDKPTYFLRKTIPLPALELVKHITTKNPYPKQILDNRDLIALQKCCNA